MSALRPSNLPKLAVCPCYEPRPDAGPNAMRGSVLDTIFRARMSGGPVQGDLIYTPTDEDMEAIGWAEVTLRALAGGADIVCREADCRIAVPGLDNPGTADAIVASRMTLADLKTGLVRNYREQMAGYALGLMERHFASEWTAHLLFCDARQVVTHRFTHGEAAAIVRAIVERHDDPAKRPAPCEYCAWCALAERCPARTRLATAALAPAEPGFDFDALLADNDRLGRFLTACSILDGFRERAERAARERLGAGIAIAGWRLRNNRGKEFVDHVSVGHHIQALGFGPVLAAYGSLSGKKFRELWAKRMPEGKPFPEDLIKHGRSSVSLIAATGAAMTNPSDTAEE